VKLHAICAVLLVPSSVLNGGDASSQVFVADPFAAVTQSTGEAVTDLLARVTAENSTQLPPLPAPIRSLLLPPMLRAESVVPSSRPAALTLERLQQLKGRVEPVLAAEGLPPELIAVMLVESDGRVDAMSPKQARGLWQLMPDTARDYGLTVSGRRDDRLHIERATRAAAQLLKDLYAEFGSWPLALAAYNVGRSAVLRAMAKVKDGADFWTLSARGLLPPETRNYVPLVLSFMQFLRAGS